MNPKSEAYQQLFDEVRRMQNRLRWLGDHVHEGDDLTAATRSLLLSLFNHGPQTVPDMARERLVSRQIIQTQINSLQEQNWVQTRENPKHKRSVLIALTPKGKRLMTRMLKREEDLIEEVAAPVSTSELQETSAVLAKLRQHLEDSF